MRARLALRVREVGPLRAAWMRFWLRFRARRLGRRMASLPAEPADGRRREWYTALHRIVGLRSRRIVLGLEEDANRLLYGLERAERGLQAGLGRAERDTGEATVAHDEAAGYSANFERRLDHAPELFTVPPPWLRLVPATFPLLFGADLVLNLPAFQLIVPGDGGGNFVQRHLAAFIAVIITVAQAVGVRFAGREASWGWSRYVRCADEAAPEKDAPVVYSESTRRGHQVRAGLLIGMIAASVIGLVSLRIPALNLEASAHVSLNVTGLVGSGKTPHDHVNGAALSALTLLPLAIATYLSAVLEGPIRSTRRHLTRDVDRTTKALTKARKAERRQRSALAQHSTLTQEIRRSKELKQQIARLDALLASEEIADANPRLFGLYDEQAPWTFPDEAELMALAPSRFERAGRPGNGAGDPSHVAEPSSGQPPNEL